MEILLPRALFCIGTGDRYEYNQGGYAPQKYLSAALNPVSRNDEQPCTRSLDVSHLQHIRYCRHCICIVIAENVV